MQASILRRKASVAIAIIVALCIYTEARAQSCFGSFGNGACDSGELANECTVLGNFVLEICPDPSSPTFPIPGPVGSSIWRYVLSGSSQNQFSISLPSVISDAELQLGTGTSGAQYQAAGDGAPSTGFGGGILDVRVLVIDNAIGLIDFTTNSRLAEPRGVEAKKGGNGKRGTILGPSENTVAEQGNQTVQGFERPDGVTFQASTDTQGNLISVTALEPDGVTTRPVRFVPREGFVICVLNDGVDPNGVGVDPTDPDPAFYTCEVGNLPPQTPTRNNPSCYGPLAPLGNYACY
jgi:hypothetical protein